MSTEQYWQRLDTLASSKGSERLLEAAELLRDHPELPLLISCRRANGRIQHMFTSFDDRAPEAAGNRYLICFTSEKQAKKVPVTAPEVEGHEAGPDFSNLDKRYGNGGKRAAPQHGLWRPGRQRESQPPRYWPTSNEAKLWVASSSIPATRSAASL